MLSEVPDRKNGTEYEEWRVSESDTYIGAGSAATTDAIGQREPLESVRIGPHRKCRVEVADGARWLRARQSFR